MGDLQEHVSLPGPPPNPQLLVSLLFARAPLRLAEWRRPLDCLLEAFS